MKDKEKTLTTQCEQINRHMVTIIRCIEQMQDQEDDEQAYLIIHELYKINDCMVKARDAGMDECGNDVLNAYEETAKAIRAAKSQA